MNSALFARDSAVLPFTPSVDHTDKEGYLVTLAGEVATLGASATVPAEGVILDGNDVDDKDSVGILGCLPGTVRFKAGAAITKGDRLMQKNDGTVVTDVGPGTARVVVGVALEDAAADAKFEAASFAPMILP